MVFNPIIWSISACKRGAARFYVEGLRTIVGTVKIKRNNYPRKLKHPGLQWLIGLILNERIVKTEITLRLLARANDNQ